jgi:hypothetical protein
MNLDFFNREISKYNSKPVEVYEFNHGNIFYYFTSSDSSVKINGNIYKPMTLNRGEIIMSPEMQRNDLKINITQNNPLKDYLFINGDDYELKLKIYRLQIEEGLSNLMFSGTLSDFNVVNELEVEMNFMQIGQFALKKTQSYTFQYNCNHAQYDVKCGLNLINNSVRYTITNIEDNFTYITVIGSPSSAGAQDNGFFTSGILWYENEKFEEKKIHILVDFKDTDSRKITLNSTDTNLKIGQEVFLAFGCKNTKSNCISVGNFQNFLGFDYIPTKNYFRDGIPEDQS